ncbi:hypothetical protein [endosymbiont 'TC1' of Trimyema compressum]|nr:hypothetical protein [endosymbiont 'TC1' of Trimyema compressum]
MHLKIPDCIGDEKVLKRSLKKNPELVTEAELKIENAVKLLKEGKASRE